MPLRQLPSGGGASSNLLCKGANRNLKSIRGIDIVSSPRHMSLHRFAVESILADCHKSSDTDPDGVFGRVAPRAQRIGSVGPKTVRNCTKDEGRPLEAILQGRASNHLQLLWSKAMVVRV